MDLLFLLLAGVVLLKGLAGVLHSLGYQRYLDRQLSRTPPAWMPPASVIVPCKGSDFELKENMEAILDQEFEDYEVIFVTATEADPSLVTLRQASRKFPRRRVKFVVSGFSNRRGEKVHNLIQALGRVDPGSQVLVFADSDGRPHRRWLRDLLSPLRDPETGASTGYRWFFPGSGNLASLLRATWNGSVATLLGGHGRNFVWGGSMAIRRSTFAAVDVLAYWEHSVSDDYSLTAAVNAAGLRIHYQPRCLVGTHGDCSWRELLEWSTRQIIITKVYSRSLWRLALLSEWPFVLFWWWAVGELIGSALGAGSTIQTHWLQGVPLLLLLGVVWFLGAVRGLFRWRMIYRIRPEQRERLKRDCWGYLLLGPLAATLTACNLAVSLFTSTIVWRQVRYEMASSREVRVVRDL
jgi:cellulose synthase/poly-beta-1,6-N-acetylglucosamine synthase-like glycosyltransferase